MLWSNSWLTHSARSGVQLSSAPLPLPRRTVIVGCMTPLLSVQSLGILSCTALTDFCQLGLRDQRDIKTNPASASEGT